VRASQDGGPYRLPRLPPGDLDADQRAVYDAIAGEPRASGAFPLTDGDGALVGPFNAMLLQPAVGGALQALGGALRYRGVLGARARELVILAVAAHWDSAFERRAHEAVGASAGLSEEEMAAVAAGGLPPLDDAVEAAALRTAWTLLREGGLDDEGYAEACSVLGAAGLFELTTLVGYYATLALQMRVFGVED
jgi:4-carboxymuconolactone decarboxylase